MSEKSKRTVRSKIPLPQGSRTALIKPKSLDPGKDNPKQSGKITVKPGRMVNASDAVKHEQPKIDGDTPFEPDPRALDSILSNKGISFGVARASEMVPSAVVTEEGTIGKICKSSVCHQVPVNRLSMWESLNEFKQNLRKYKDSFQQLNVNVKTDLRPVTPTRNCNKSSGLTPRSCRTSSRPAEMTLMESYEQHKENIKIFRETMRNIDNVSLAPKALGNNVYGAITPKQRQRGLTNTMRATSSATPMNGNVRRAWTELKENRPPHERMKKPGSLSTSKVNPSKLHAIDETSPSSKDIVCCPVKPVRRTLLLSSDGNRLTEKASEFNGCDRASRENCHKIERYQPVVVSSSVKDHLVQHSLHSNWGNEPSAGLPTTSGLVFKSPDIIQVSRIIPVFLTPKSPFPGGVSSSVSSTNCTWSCQQTMCTPRYKASEKVYEAADNFQRIQSTQTVNTPTVSSSKMLNYNTQAVTGMESTPTFLHTYRTSQDSKSSLQLPQSAAGELNDHFSKLLLSSNSIGSTAATSQPHVSVPKLWQGNPPSLSTAPVLSTPVRAFHANTFMSVTSSMATNCPQSTVTPLAQLSRVFVGDQRSPATPLCFPVQTSRQNDAVASCLKKGFTKLDNTDGLYMQYPVSSVKKLRWADGQNCVQHYES